MALPASAISSSISPVTSFNNRLSQLDRPLFLRIRRSRASATTKVKLLPRMEQFHVPPKLNIYLTYTKEKLWESTPDAVKQFPWEEAKNVARQKLLFYGKEALKWSLIASLIFSFASDVIYSISKDNEFLIPFGLFVGCLMANYLNEVSQELLHHNKEKRKDSGQLLGVFCFFIFVNVISRYFPVGGSVFLLHVANGGLMQVLWHWRSLRQQDTDEREVYE